METRNQILTELQEIAPRLGQGGLSRVPYEVPSGFFADFPDLLMFRIRLETGGYSENATRDISEISPLLSGLRDKITYQAPEGFFESLHAKIPAAENAGQVVPFFNTASDSRSGRDKKVISLPVRILRYAAAACIVGLHGGSRCPGENFCRTQRAVGFGCGAHPSLFGQLGLAANRDLRA